MKVVAFNGSPRNPKKYYYEYVRNGTVKIFISMEFKVGKRLTQITKRRTMMDFAQFVKILSIEK
jgi:hypothetical protein